MSKAPGIGDTSSHSPAPAARALQRLRLRVTAWYVGTFAFILVTLGVLLFAALAHDLSVGLDASLRAATREIAKAAGQREHERATNGAAAIDAVEELRIPERQLYLFDLTGHPLTPARADGKLRDVARRAALGGPVSARWHSPNDVTLQAYAERFTTSGGTGYVAAAAVDRDTLDDRYEALLAVTGALGALGLVLVASGGWLLARKAVAPVESAMEQMRRLTTDAAHELRTPLAVIRSRVDVALEQPRDAGAYAAMLTELRGEIERVAALVNDLFTLARADADARAFSPSRVQLDEVVLDAVSTAGWIAARRGVVLSVVEAEEAVIDGDASLLRQLALILLDNAIKFSDEGGTVSITVRASTHEASLVVEDEGPGIAEADLPRVFDRFYRSESVRGETAGAGLGLAIARWIIDVHRARIVLERAARRGTRATVAFPIAEHVGVE